VRRLAGQCPECRKFSLFEYKEKTSGGVTMIKVKCANCGYEDTLDFFATPDDDEDEEYEEEEDEDEYEEDEE
jgi:hypothetical protein